MRIRLKIAEDYLATKCFFMERLHIRCWDRGWIWVFENISLEVTQGDFVRTGIDHVVWIDGDFSAAAGAIDDELWHGVASGMSA